MHEIYSHTVDSVPFERVKCIRGYESIRAEYPSYLTDESKLNAQPFELLFFPSDEAELSAVVKECARQKIPITIAGARTGLVGGCVPMQGALISMEHFDQVEAVFHDPVREEWVVRAQAAVSLKTLEAMLRSKNIPIHPGNPNTFAQEELQRFKNDPASYFYQPDPTEMSASLGGSVATNASGARTYRYGPTRAWVRGLRVLLADGEMLDIARGLTFASAARQFILKTSTGAERSIPVPDYPMPETKNAAGYYAAPGMDLIDLFIGSEGTLGLVTQIEVALIQQHPKMAFIQFLESDEQAVNLAAALRADERVALDYLEFYSGNALQLLGRSELSIHYPTGLPVIPEGAGSALFYEINRDPNTEDAVLTALDQITSTCGADLGNSWAASEPAELEDFQRLRHLLPETVNAVISERKQRFPGLHKLSTDLAVPDKHLGDIWSAYQAGCQGGGFEWVAFGHIGDNHIHVNILPRNMEELQAGKALMEKFAGQAVSLGGTVSAEHGIGRLKRNLLGLMYTPAQIDQMRQVKSTLDPDGILNPGVIFE
jgi:D-lactate dehydrogenase (cytochrome)